MLSKVELPIYNDQDEVVAQFSVSRIRWGIIEDVVELTERLQGQTEAQAITAMGDFLTKVFSGLTSDHLRQADVLDVKRCFQQIVSLVKQLETQDLKNR
jgi:hypothetical protein